jgi:hypothetical protein
MTSAKSLLNDAARFRREIAAGNRFMTREFIDGHVARMEAAYLDARTPSRLAHRLHAEIDLLSEAGR